MTITGTSLDGTTVTVSVDGITCDVQTVSLTEVTCITAEKVMNPAAGTPVSYIGQQGLNRYWFGQGSPHSTWRTMIDTADMLDKNMTTAIDYSQFTGDTLTFTAFEGFFKAPVTG